MKIWSFKSPIQLMQLMAVLQTWKISCDVIMDSLMPENKSSLMGFFQVFQANENQKKGQPQNWSCPDFDFRQPLGIYLAGCSPALPASHYPAEQSWKQEANSDAIPSKNSASKMSIRDWVLWNSLQNVHYSWIEYNKKRPSMDGLLIDCNDD